MKKFLALVCATTLVACGGGGQSANSGPAPTFSLGGSVRGLGSASGLVLANGTETLPVAASANTFTFPTRLPPGTSYSVTVANQPTGLKCTVSAGSGVVPGTNVDTVAIECVTQAPAELALLAGNLGSAGNVDGMGAAARLQNPQGLATDSAGNVYVADKYNHTVRKITPTGMVSTLAGSAGIPGSADGIGATARFAEPQGLAIDSMGNIYVSESVNHTIRKITPTGVVSTLAGAAGLAGSSDGTGTAARFSQPQGLATDNADNIYVTDGQVRVRKITPTGVVSTLAGSGSWGSTDGVGANVSFSRPTGIATDSAGNVYVADSDNHTIRKISPAGVVSTWIGTPGVDGSTDGTGAAARLRYPTGLAIDNMGNVYVTEPLNYTIRKITPDGEVSTLAGSTGIPGSADGMGTAARFFIPSGIAVNTAGNVYVADSGNQTIRKLTPTGTVSTLAGAVELSGSADGMGAEARFTGPMAIAADTAGNVYVSDADRRSIRKITPTGMVSTWVGTPGVAGSADGIGPAARFGNVQALATDSVGNVYAADGSSTLGESSSQGNHTIRKITPNGVVSTLAGTPGVSGFTDGVGTAASFKRMDSLATDRAGNVYVAGSFTIRKISPNGVVSTLAGDGNTVGTTNGVGTSARFRYLPGMATDAAGNVFVTDAKFCQGPGCNSDAPMIRKITPTGVVSTLAGPGGSPWIADGIGAAAFFDDPKGMAADSEGNIYVADSYNKHSIRKITPAGVVSTVVGGSGRFGFAAGALPGSLYRPSGLAISGTTLYITMLHGVAMVTTLP